MINDFDCMKELAELKMEMVLVKERIREAKEDKEKAAKTFMWVGGMIFAIVSAVAAFGIDSKATISVHDEKINEIKMEVKELSG